MNKFVSVIYVIFILSVSSCGRDEFYEKKEPLKTIFKANLQTLKARQKVALIASCLNIVATEGAKGNEKKINKLLSLCYNDTVNSTISDTVVNSALKINLKKNIYIS